MEFSAPQSLLWCMCACHAGVCVCARTYTFSRFHEPVRPGLFSLPLPGEDIDMYMSADPHYTAHE